MEEDMSEIYDNIIIGGGIFGCLCAIELSKLDKKVYHIFGTFIKLLSIFENTLFTYNKYI